MNTGQKINPAINTPGAIAARTTLFINSNAEALVCKYHGLMLVQTCVFEVGKPSCGIGHVVLCICPNKL